MHHKIKVMVRATPTGDTLADLIDKLNHIITRWRNYYWYATGANSAFSSLDW
ncbi:group II intron maturase-specific domain-containing protein [Bradyrhizobium sp. USDA 4532]|uniref:group II intron maturase-specific domain-containing protein n=1 Tax=unclassified Bradyrhizobium TaxID=2631580 RepID=UPI0035C6A593